MFQFFQTLLASSQLNEVCQSHRALLLPERRTSTSRSDISNPQGRRWKCQCRERERECGKKQVQRQTVWEKGREWGGIEGMRKRIGIMCQSLQNSGREGIDLFHLGLCTIPYLLSPTLRQEVPCGQETAWRYHSNQCVGSRIKVHRAEKKYSMIMQDHIHEWLIKPAKIRQFWIILHVAIPIAIIM